MKAKVSIYGHPVGAGPGDERDMPLVSTFFTTGEMHRSDHKLGHGCVFFGFMVDYSGLSPSFPRAHYPHSLIAAAFDFDTRRGTYFTCPYGGRIEIEAAE